MGPNLTQAQGMILGTAAKMFTIAGPVTVYGLAASVVYGFIISCMAKKAASKPYAVNPLARILKKHLPRLCASR